MCLGCFGEELVRALWGAELAGKWLWSYEQGCWIFVWLSLPQYYIQGKGTRIYFM